jgi:hypothetical protein
MPKLRIQYMKFRNCCSSSKLCQATIIRLNNKLDSKCWTLFDSCDGMHCCSCSKSVHQCCPCSKVQASNDNVCHDQCVASHDDMTRFGATMHQLLCKILVIMQLAYVSDHIQQKLAMNFQYQQLIKNQT